MGHRARKQRALYRYTTRECFMAGHQSHQIRNLLAGGYHPDYALNNCVHEPISGLDQVKSLGMRFGYSFVNVSDIIISVLKFVCDDIMRLPAAQWSALSGLIYQLGLTGANTPERPVMSLDDSVLTVVIRDGAHFSGFVRHGLRCNFVSRKSFSVSVTSGTCVQACCR